MRELSGTRKVEMRVNRQETITKNIYVHNIIPNPSQDNVAIHTEPKVGGKALAWALRHAQASTARQKLANKRSQTGRQSRGFWIFCLRSTVIKVRLCDELGITRIYTQKKFGVCWLWNSQVHLLVLKSRVESLVESRFLTVLYLAACNFFSFLFFFPFIFCFSYLYSKDHLYVHDLRNMCRCKCVAHLEWPPHSLRIRN